MTPTPIFPHVIDSSMRSSFKACMRQGYYGHILGLHKEAKSIDLHFGGCMASGLEAARKAFWRDGLGAEQAVCTGVERVLVAWGDFPMPMKPTTKTLDACIDALVSYFERYPLGADAIEPVMVEGEPAFEMSFALPIPSCFHPIDGEPILYAGRFDMLGRFHNAIMVVDEKTSSRLGDQWLSSWNLRGQLTGYCWGARSFGVDVAGCIIRGIGILKGDITFMEAIVSRPQWHIDMWLHQLQRDVESMKRAWHGMTLFPDEPYKTWDQSLDSACTAYGVGCGFCDLCDTPDPTRYYDDFVVSRWNPLTREDEK